MSARQEHAHCMCLVCGEKLAVYDARQGVKQTDYINGTLACSYENDEERPCRFRVHSKCWSVHCDVQDQGSRVFECGKVVYQLPGETVSKLGQGDQVQGRDQLILNLEKFNRVKINKCKRKRRYQNSADVCRICGEEVPFHQKSHLLQHCSGINATPVVVEDVTDYGALGRRCFEISQRRSEVRNITLVTPGTPQRSRAVGWGWRPGQRLSEVNPRTKRPRLDFENENQD